MENTARKTNKGRLAQKTNYKIAKEMFEIETTILPYRQEKNGNTVPEDVTQSATG